MISETNQRIFKKFLKNEYLIDAAKILNVTQESGWSGGCETCEFEYDEVKFRYETPDGDVRYVSESYFDFVRFITEYVLGEGE